MKSTLLKVVIPMAGLGTRLRPHTWSKPKPLVSVAGKAVLDHIIDSLSSLPDPDNIELISIVGNQGDQIEEYVREHYPALKAHYIVQENPRGQSHAIKLAQEYLDGPTIVILGDTLIRSDLSFLAKEEADAIAWVKPVPDPRRFGVVELGEDGWVKRLIEKPADLRNNLAVVGFYYINEARDLLKAIDEQIHRNLQLKGEFYLVDAMNIMLEHGLKMRTHLVDVWLDAGTPEALLETNRYLLENGQDNSHEACLRTGSVIVPPVFIHPTARVENSVVGPHVSLGTGCIVQNSIIMNSILEEEAQTVNVILESSLIGRRAVLRRRAGIINAGDNSEVTL
jgi:glucose-1-phosphate thymidylyltransferase